MMKKTTVLIIVIIGFIVIISSQFLSAIDTPHNESNNVNCGSCHGEAILNSPFWGGNMTYDQLCLSCHWAPSGPFSDTYAPLVVTHSSETTSTNYGDWSRECIDCHDPHYQLQKNYKNTDASRLYLATGTITACLYNGDNTSTLTYSTISYKSGWDSTKLTQKTSAYRRTVLFPNVGKLGYDYPIIAVDTPDVNKITVSGNACTYLSPPTTYAAMYGQYVRSTIDLTGTSKTVKFFDQTGTNSFADGNTTYDGVCEVCHTQTQNPQTHVARYRNTGNEDTGHYPAENCVDCHPHSEGFKGSESAGGITCQGCHADLRGYMSGTTGYHHYMNNPNASYATASQPVNIGDTSDTKRNCLMCHVDHNIFRPDKNPDGGRAKNLRASVSVTPSAADTSTYSNTDFDNAQPEGGICISCHATAQTKSFTQVDNTTETPVIEKNSFSQSDHNYAVMSTFGTDSSTFNADCSKCHNDTLNPKSSYNAQSSTNKFGNHQSAIRNVSATLGVTSPTDPLEERFCFGCHGETPILYSTDTLFFRDSVPVSPAPTASASTDTFGGGTWQARTMQPSQGSGVETQNCSVTAGQYWKMTSFVSPPVAATTNIPAGTWTLRIWAYQSGSFTNGKVRVTIYVWTSANAKGTVITAPITPDGHVATIPTAYTYNLSGSAATLNAGDKVVVELEFETSVSTIPGVLTYLWNGAGTTDDSKIIMPAPVTFSSPSSKDYYGVKEMSASSKDISMVFQKPKILTINTNILFLNGTYAAWPAPFYHSASTDTFLNPSIPWYSYDMLQASDTYWWQYTNPDTSVGYWQTAGFVSPAVAATTNIPASTWTLRIWANTTSATNYYVRVTIYVWTSANAKGTVILAPTTPGGPVSSTLTAYTYNLSGGAVTLNPGDRIVIELEVETGTHSDSPSLVYYWGTSTYDSKLTLPANITFAYPPPAYGHNIFIYSGIHKPSPTDETAEYLSANKHVECNDCHNPHAAKAGSYSNQAHVAARSNLISDSGPLTGAQGVEPTWSATNWGGTSAWPTTTSPATKEYQICFKCHAGYNTNFYAWGGAAGYDAWTDVALEFNPNNKSYHPVVQALSPSQQLPPAFTSLVIGDSGKDQSSNSTSITIDSAYKSWTVNQWVNWGLRIGGFYCTTGGNPVYNNIRRIASNTATRLTVDTPFSGGTIESGYTTYSIEYYAGRASSSYQPGDGKLGLTVTDSSKNFGLYLPSLAGYVVVVSDDLGNNLAKGTVTSNDATSFTVDNWTVLNGDTPPNGTVGYYFSATGHTMMCSDCHGNDTISSNAASGPHGSAVKWMLKGRNRAWPTNSASRNGHGIYENSGSSLYQLVSVNGRSTYTDGTPNGLFCLNCHSTITFTKDANGLDSADACNNIHGFHGLFACVSCHTMVPHGGKISRLIGDGDGNMPARYAFNNDLSNMNVYSFLKAPSITSYQTSNCVASCHTGGVGGEDW